MEQDSYRDQSQQSSSIDANQSDLSVPTTRSSARVRAAKQREHPSEPSTSTQAARSPINLRNRTVSSAPIRGKQKESNRTRRSTASTPTTVAAEESTADKKGKKRAAPEPSPSPSTSGAEIDEELSTNHSPPRKFRRTRNSAKVSSEAAAISTKASQNKKPMSKKSKVNASGAKSKASRSRTSGGSSTLLDGDVEMFDVDMPFENDYPDEPMEAQEKLLEPEGEDPDDHPDQPRNDRDTTSNNVQPPSATTAGSDAPPAPPTPSTDPLAIFGGDASSAAMALFGSDFRSLGAHMLAQSAKLKGYLAALKPASDPTVRFAALQELNELLVMSNEDTLSGYFQVDAFVKELVGVLGGKSPVLDDEEGDDADEDRDEEDEDAALAAALAMSGGTVSHGDENPEAQVLASRCLYNLMEALPGTAHTVVYHGAIPALCSKLLEITFIDLAEQNISTLDKISEECAGAVARQGGLPALLNFLDFFNTSVQRTALHAAANCCRNASAEIFKTIREVFPILRNVLSYPDQRLVESSALCVIRIIESYHRSQSELLEELLLQDDLGVIRAINNLLNPAAGSSVTPGSTYTLLLRALSTAAKSSPKIAIALLEADIVSVVYQLLTGVLPSGEGGGSATGTLADMAVMQNLAHRPKDQVEEALSLVSELMPPLPKDGVFDQRAYSEKALVRLTKAKAKAERTASKPNKSTGTDTPPTDENMESVAPKDPASTMQDTAARISSPSAIAELPSALAVIPPELRQSASATRLSMLRSKPQLVNRFMGLIVPVLVEVYAASVALTIRTRTLTTLLKAFSFLESSALFQIAENVPVASFIGSILSSEDQQSLVASALQLVELLLINLPSEYTAAFRREGVLHEVTTIADQELTPKPKAESSNSANTSILGDGTGMSTASLIISSSSSLRRSASYLDSQDTNILRARMIRIKYFSSPSDSGAGGQDTFALLQNLVKGLANTHASEGEYKGMLDSIAKLFEGKGTGLSSFELLQSGLVDELLGFSTSEGREVDLDRRRELLVSSLSPLNSQFASSSPFATLVKRLQESLTRIETFEVVTVTPAGDDSRRNSASLLARQLRLRLVGEGADIPKNCTNITVSIHAIATFQALYDYLLSRLSPQGLPPSRLTGVLAAFAAAAGLPPGVLSRPPPGSASQPPSERNNASSSAAVSSAQAEPSVSAAVRPSTYAPGTPKASKESKREPTRRSRRLSAKSARSSGISAPVGSDIPATAGTPSSAPPESNVGPSNGMIDMDGEEDDFVDAEVDAQMFDHGDEPPPISEKTVSVAVADEGRVVAQTPDGTRVATPNPFREKEPQPPPTTSRSSYASAVKAPPPDWHIEFAIEGHPIPLDTTVYGAIHQHEARKSNKPSQYLGTIWAGVHTVKFKKVSGPTPVVNNADALERFTSSASISDDSATSRILRLLRVLYELNTELQEESMNAVNDRALPEPAFVNNKLTAKLTRQLEEPMIVVSACLPDWATDLPQNYPFLFPFTTRFAFLQSTSFGYARLMNKWQTQSGRNNDSSSRRDDSAHSLGRLQRQKVRISRKHPLESAIRILELYGSSSSVLEVEYFEEVGTGLGPTLEFYSLVSKEFARRNIKMWHDNDVNLSGPYVHHPAGLYPIPFSPSDVAKEGESAEKRRSDIFRHLGQFVAKALLDSRIIDISFNRVFLRLVLGRDVPRTVDTLMAVDSGLGRSLARVQEYAVAVKRIREDPTLSESESAKDLESLRINDASLDDLALDFTTPGYDIELKPAGSSINVDYTNVQEYIDLVLDQFLGVGAKVQVKAFREGFSKVFPILDLQIFTSDEILTIFGNFQEDWSTETLLEALKADHGFNTDSRPFRDLVQVMSSFDLSTRREFLQFMTGSPKLPIGGFRGLNPLLTVVRKPHESPLTPDDYLPSVMTCVNYLKLPAYSSKAVLQAKLQIAMKEGGGSFHLS